MLLLPGACSKHCGAKSDVEEWDGGMGAPIESHHGATEAWVLPEVLGCFEFRQVLSLGRFWDVFWKISGKETRKEKQIAEEDSTRPWMGWRRRPNIRHLAFIYCFCHGAFNVSSITWINELPCWKVENMLPSLLPRFDKVFRHPKAPEVFLDIIRTSSPLVRHLGWLWWAFQLNPKVAWSPTLAFKHYYYLRLSCWAGRHRSVAFGVLLFVLLTDPWTKVWFGLPC